MLETIFTKTELSTIDKRIKNINLTQTERNYLSRSIRPKILAARIISSWDGLHKLTLCKNMDSLINYNLKSYGYGLFSKAETKKKIRLEELIILILTRSQKARYIEAIPILLIKNKVNPLRLLDLALKYNLVNQIGYLVETSIIIAKKHKIKTGLEELLEYLASIKQDKDDFITRSDSSYREFLMATSPPRLRLWRLYGRFYDEDFFELSKVYL